MGLPNGVPEQPVAGRRSAHRIAFGRGCWSLGRERTTDRFHPEQPFGAHFPNDLDWSLPESPHLNIYAVSLEKASHTSLARVGRYHRNRNHTSAEGVDPLLEVVSGSDPAGLLVSLMGEAAVRGQGGEQRGMRTAID